MYREI
jgi:hypothetical protein